MIKQNKGYSLGVLVITIAVMIILTTTALISFRSMSADKDITNFMNDLQEVEEYVKEYYGAKRILPLQYDSDNKPIGITLFDYENMRAQADASDFGSYFYVDLTKLERIHLNDYDRGYIVNENSFRIYVTKPINYQEIDYYTVTDEMKGYDKTYNENTDFEIVISGNPIAWTDKAKLILSIPNLIPNDNLTSEWTFKYFTNGPISAEEFKDKGKLFIYGETIEITENGIVTFYVENITSNESGEVGYAKTLNVVIDKIDDISPNIKIIGEASINDKVIITDNETGINPDKLLYKIINYDDIEDSKNGRQLLTYGTRYKKYIEEYEKLNSRYQDLSDEISDLMAIGSGEAELANHRAELNNIQADINTLNDQNRDFNDGTKPYSDEKANIAIYVEDYAGNTAEYKDGISRNVLLNSNLIDFETEVLGNSTFSIAKTMPYTSGDEVNLRIRSQGATRMLITTDSSIDPSDISNYIDYEASNGNYKFDISSEVGPEVTIYAYYTAGEYDDRGNLIYKSLSDTITIDRVNPTIDAPDVNISNQLELDITVNQEDKESGIYKIEYGYQLVDGEEKLTKYTWVDSVAEVEESLEAGKNYYIKTRIIDKAGNGPIQSDYTILRCPAKKIVSIPNEPKLGDMKAITWKSNMEEIEINPSTLKDSSGVTRVWYNYELGNGTSDEGISKWANAKSDDGSYWVWIPRYAYKIIYYTDATKTEIKGYYQNSPYTNTIGYYKADGETLSTESAVKTKYGSIDIVFLYNTTNEMYTDADTKIVKTLVESTEKPYSEYIVHPAFKAYSTGTKVNTQGNWNGELTGIWVAKFEASRSDADFTNEGTSTTIKIVPSVKNINNVTVSEAYNYAATINSSMNSHLMKNSEWGAVAYLAYSDYGRCGNQIKKNLASNMVTGAGTTSDGDNYATTTESIFEDRYGYKTLVGMETSTTNNIYGVYDLVGGAEEYVAAYIDNDNTIIESNGGALQIAGINFVQVYNEGLTDNSLNNYSVNSEIYGDAIYEVSINDTNMWEDNNISYPSGTEPFFIRGGSYATSDAGIFDVNKGDGSANPEISFRAVLAY